MTSWTDLNHAYLRRETSDCRNFCTNRFVMKNCVEYQISFSSYTPHLMLLLLLLLVFLCLLLSPVPSWLPVFHPFDPLKADKITVVRHTKPTRLGPSTQTVVLRFDDIPSLVVRRAPQIQSNHRILFLVCFLVSPSQQGFFVALTAGNKRIMVM